jgi:hypothetical protein
MSANASRSVRRGVVVLFAAVASTATAACDRENRGSFDAAFTGPSPFGPPAPFVGAQVRPNTVAFTAVQSFSCPLIPPFTTSFAVLVDQRGEPDLFMDAAAFRFIDGSGRSSPLQLDRRDLTRMFGTTTVPSGTRRTFDFHPQFGCGFSTVPSALVIDVFFLDGNGARHLRTLNAAFR